MKLLYTQILFIWIVTCTSADEHYVSAPNGATCPGNSTCKDLSFYLADPDIYFTDNTIIYFLEGTHYIEDKELIIIGDISNLTLEGLGEIEQGSHETLTESTVKIQCRQSTSGFAVENSSYIIFKNIAFIGCGGEAYQSYFGIVNVTLIFTLVSNVTLESVSVLNGSGMGLIMSNSLDIYIHNSSFGFNRLTPTCLKEELLCGGGNVFVHLFDPPIESETVVSVEITGSNFSFGFSSIFGVSGGLTVFKENFDTVYKINIILDRLVSFGNAGIVGPNFHFSITGHSETSYNVLINNTISTFGNAFVDIPTAITDVILITGGAFSFLDNMQSHNDSTLTIANSEFSNSIVNAYGGLLIGWIVDDLTNIATTIENCIIVNNTGNIGGGLYMYGSKAIDSPNLNVIMKNVAFENNKANRYGDSLNAAAVFQNLNIKAENLAVINNKLSGIVCLATVITISGHNQIANNTGIDGGGIALYESSYLVVDTPSFTNFINNSASDKGGGIYVSQVVQTTGIDMSCFFQKTRQSNLQYAEFYFEGNTAVSAGDALYGGNVFQCLESGFFSFLFNYTNQRGVSVISSEPFKVCFCEDQVPNCLKGGDFLSISPGESFNTSLIIVGQGNGGTTGVLRITDFTNAPVTTLTTLEAQCNNVSYAVQISNSSQESSTIYLTLESVVNPSEDPDSKLLFISIQPCPPGFSFYSDIGKCECEGVLQNVRGVECDVTTQEMSRDGGVWMGYDNNSNCTIVREDCPYNYCITGTVTFHITEPDPQCALDRSGIMCGQCAEGLSLMIGSNECGKCSNAYISLIIVFFLSGIALVAFIVALNFTVSLGTINGLIFYANMVKINEDQYYPDGPIPLLSQFISWINLDFGIRSCFYDGMTAIGKAWLHFVFPVYLWILVGILILLARYSTKIAKLLGNSSVPVLATLMLLSYVKVFRAVVNALTGTTIVCGYEEYNVWYVDPNVPYNRPDHSTLVIVAGIFLFGVALPYTIVLLFNDLISRCLTRDKCIAVGCSRFRLSIRLFIDAYNAPYKPYFTFWTGFLLLIRFITVLVVAFRSNDDILIAMGTLIALTLGLLACFGGVYKKWYLNILEVWFIFNLAFMTAFAAHKDGQIASGISTTLTLITYIGILGFHICLRLAKPVKSSKHTRALIEKTKSLFEKRSQSVLLEDSVVKHDDLVRSTSIHVELRRRETLLDPLYVIPNHNNAQAI